MILYYIAKMTPTPFTAVLLSPLNYRIMDTQFHSSTFSPGKWLEDSPRLMSQDENHTVE